MGRRLALSVLFIAAVASTTVARAEATLTLDWEADQSECPREGAIRDEVTRLLGGRAPGSATHVRAVVAREGAGAWAVELTVSAGDDPPRHRRLRGESCSVVAEASALVIALALDPDALPPANEGTGNDSPGHEDATGPPRGEARNAPSTREPSPAQAAAETADRLPSPRPASPRPVGPSARRLAAAGPERTSDGGASWVSATAEDGRSRASSGAARWRVAVGAAVDGGAVPGTAVGPTAAIGVRLADLVVFEARAIWLPARVGRLEGHPSARGEVGLLAADVGACFPLVDGALAWGPCAGLEVGMLGADGAGVSRPDNSTALWVAARGGMVGAARLVGPLFLRASADLMVPLNRPAFIFDGLVGEVHRPDPVSFRARLGLEVRFR